MTVREQLNAIAAQRILILDGAMGSMIQSQKLSEADFRGGRFANHTRSLLGCNDLLCLSKPETISAIHKAYLEAGADIIETCSFNATAVSLGEYGLAEYAYEISAAAACIARKAADTFSTVDKPRFVAGSIGPTAKSAGIAPDINDLSKRVIYWDELEAAYYDNARGLLDGGADILLVETIFDTLNAKAALFAISRLTEERSIDIPIMISATVAGDSGRLLTGQTLEAFCASVQHCAPWSIGLNCSFGAEKLLLHLRALSAAVSKGGAVPCMISAHPNAGLPNHSGGYDEGPETMAACIEGYLQDGLLNIAGGCCGTTPAHIAAIAEKAALYQPRVPPPPGKMLTLAGLELLEISGDFQSLISKQINISVSDSGSSEEDFEDTADSACDAIEGGAAILNIGIDDAMPDAEQTIGAFLDFALFNPAIAKAPVMIDSSRRDIIEAALKHLPGKGLVNAKNLKDSEIALVRRYGAVCVNVTPE